MLGPFHLSFLRSPSNSSLVTTSLPYHRVPLASLYPLIHSFPFLSLPAHLSLLPPHNQNLLSHVDPGNLIHDHPITLPTPMPPQPFRDTAPTKAPSSPPLTALTQRGPTRTPLACCATANEGNLVEDGADGVEEHVCEDEEDPWADGYEGEEQL